MSYCLSVVLAVYVVYVLNYFKTIYSIAHPLSYFKYRYMFHPIYNTKTKKSMICQFGHDASWFIALFLLVRLYVSHKKMVSNKLIKQFSKLVALLVFTISLVNLNAVLYLIPYFIHEFLFIKNMI
jgi:hypothetical protein